MEDSLVTGDVHEIHSSLELTRTNSSDRMRHFQIELDDNEIHRRRSSLVPEDGKQSRKTDCFVHSLLEAQKGICSEDHSPSYKGLAQERRADKAPNEKNGFEHHSRLLSKRQISDMAVSIRELAKRLAHIKVKMKVQNVFLLCKAHDTGLIKKAREVTEWILNQGYKVYIEDILQDKKSFDATGLLESNPKFDGRLKYWTNQLCKERPKMFDIVLALGGDGTVLYASWLFQQVVPPVLSFSLGSLGFLTKFDFDKYQETLEISFNQGINVSLRLRFEATVMRSQKKDEDVDRDLVEELVGSDSDDEYTHKPDGTHNILNEVVVDRGPNATMSSIELFGDDEHFTSIQADGICIATPTGSTAYNLAAGGSLCHPDNPVILVTAICAHTLSFRPIILPDTIVLRAGVPYDARTSSWASFDGRERVELCPGDYVTVSASRFPFPSVMPLDRRGEWVDSISRTLNWNSRSSRPKEFKD